MNMTGKTVSELIKMNSVSQNGQNITLNGSPQRCDSPLSKVFIINDDFKNQTDGQTQL